VFLLGFRSAEFPNYFLICSMIRDNSSSHEKSIQVGHLIFAQFDGARRKSIAADKAKLDLVRRNQLMNHRMILHTNFFHFPNDLPNTFCVISLCV